MPAQRQAIDVVKDASAQPANDVGSESPASVPERVYENLVQHAEHIHDKLERTDAALQVEIKRAQVSSKVIEKLRQELRNTGKAQSTSDPAQCVQRISALEVELRHKDFELQNEVQRVDLLSESVNVLREELLKKGPGCPAQFRVVSVLSDDSRGCSLYVLRS